jgi:hypothetical protein
MAVLNSPSGAPCLSMGPFSLVFMVPIVVYGSRSKVLGREGRIGSHGKTSLSRVGLGFDVVAVVRWQGTVRQEREMSATESSR